MGEPKIVSVFSFGLAILLTVVMANCILIGEETQPAWKHSLKSAFNKHGPFLIMFDVWCLRGFADENFFSEIDEREALKPQDYESLAETAYHGASRIFPLLHVAQENKTVERSVNITTHRAFFRGEANGKLFFLVIEKNENALGFKNPVHCTLALIWLRDLTEENPLGFVSGARAVVGLHRDSSGVCYTNVQEPSDITTLTNSVLSAITSLSIDGTGCLFVRGKSLTFCGSVAVQGEPVKFNCQGQLGPSALGLHLDAVRQSPGPDVKPFVGFSVKSGLTKQPNWGPITLEKK